MNPTGPERGQVPAPAACGRQLENHRLPAHLQDYDVASPQINSALSVEKGSIVEAIYLYTKFTASCIFLEWAAFEDELVLLQKPGVGIVGGQQHLELALMGKNTDWAAVWQSIWMPNGVGPGLPAERVKALAYNSQLHASDAGVELMLRGFPRLDAFSPHRVQVLGHRTYNRQGYSLRIHHHRVLGAACRGLNPSATGPFYDTAEISPIPVQEGLIRLMLPIPEVHLWGDRDEKKFLGPIRLAHELILNEWASEARLLHMSRHEFPPTPGQEIRLKRPPLSSVSDAEQHLDVVVELRELVRYFRVVRAIQEVLVLNELVMQCTKPAGGSAALVHRVRLQEQMDLRDLCIGPGPTPRPSIEEQTREILAQKHLNNMAGGVGTTYNPPLHKPNDPTLSVEPRWVASFPSVNPTARAGSGKVRTASPSELSFIIQTAEQRARSLRALHSQLNPAMSLEAEMHARVPPHPRRSSRAELASVTAGRLPRMPVIPDAHQQEAPVSYDNYHWQPPPGPPAEQYTPRELQHQPQMEQRQPPANQPRGALPSHPNSFSIPQKLPHANKTPIPFWQILNSEAPGASVRDPPVENGYNIVLPQQAPTDGATRSSIVAQNQSQPSVL
ncbi:hypothetical protein EV426DRAFT_674525 [Tirmania nivea]|nr:hypothetical protein EV426DRAFT_674525 [Tirmania nivea]